MMVKLEEGLTHCNPEAAVSAPVLKCRLLALRAAPAQQMSHFWLTYGSADGLVGVVIMEAPSMLQARMTSGPSSAPSTTSSSWPRGGICPKRCRWPLEQANGVLPRRQNNETASLA